MALTTKGHFRVDGKEFVAKSINLKYESLADENSGRTDDGVMHIYWIFSRIRKIEITMPPCTVAESASILSLVQGKTYSLTYFDILSNTERTLQVYTSNSSGDIMSGVIMNGLVTGLKFNAIELAGENA